MIARVPDTEQPEERSLRTTDRILIEEPFLRRLAMRLSRRPTDADDLVQETLFRAYRARDRFQTGTSMRAWLATILRRLFLTAASTEQRRRTATDTDLGDPIGALSETGETGLEPTSANLGAAMEGLDDRVARAFGQLPDAYRTPFVLFALDGLTYAEIARHLAVPIGTVMSRIHRARLRLREAAMQKTTGEVSV
jgi:RNA polymerase sigma-70 factor (ECF subfamily)